MSLFRLNPLSWLAIVLTTIVGVLGFVAQHDASVARAAVDAANREWQKERAALIEARTKAVKDREANNAAKVAELRNENAAVLAEAAGMLAEFDDELKKKKPRPCWDANVVKHLSK